MMKHNFAAFILTHGRAANIPTIETIRRSGYTGKIYFIIDNEDPTADAYYERYGRDNVIIFDKAAVAATFDEAEVCHDRRTITYARNASFKIAADLGLDYFWQLDDDYSDLRWRWWDRSAQQSRLKNLDAVLDALIDFLDTSGAASVAMSQGGDHIGAEYLRRHTMLKRKAMNTFIFRTDNPITFLGRFNEDVNTYVTYGSRGTLFLTVLTLQMNQLRTQSLTGGISELYAQHGTYHKTMTTVMMHPSSVTARTLGPTNPRIHHQIRWRNTVPMILSDKHQKPRT